MQAQIRFANKGEFKGLIPPLVCVFGEKVRFMFNQYGNELTDVVKAVSYKPKHHFLGCSYVYQLTETEKLNVTSDAGEWCFNGLPAKEEWPTTNRRHFRCGDHIIDVKPEDDTLSFLVSNDSSDIVRAIIAFYLKCGCGSGGYYSN